MSNRRGVLEVDVATELKVTFEHDFDEVHFCEACNVSLDAEVLEAQSCELLEAEFLDKKMTDALRASMRAVIMAFWAPFHGGEDICFRCAQKRNRLFKADAHVTH